jgi:hypothetical protein
MMLISTCIERGNQILAEFVYIVIEEARMNRLITIVSLFILIALSAACGGSTPVPTIMPTLAPTRAATQAPNTVLPASTNSPALPTVSSSGATGVPPSVDLGETTIYTDEVAGIALDYPKDWHKLELSREQREKSVMYALTLTSWDPGTVGGGEPIPEGETKIDVAVMKTGVNSFEEAVAERKAQYVQDGTRIVSEERWTLPSGLPALRVYLTGGMSDAVEVITAVNHNTILVAGAGNYDIVHAVARTLRPM